MSHFAIATKERTSGREMRTDGLHSHLGLTETSTLRVSGAGAYPPLNGAGIEAVYTPSNDTGYLLAYDRTRNIYTDLSITARHLWLTVSGGTLHLPPGSVDTAALAQGAASGLIGSYVAVPAFSVAAGAGYLETPVQVTVTASSATGGQFRIEGQVTCVSNQVNGMCYLSLGADGSPTFTPAGLTFSGPIGYPVSAHFVWHTPLVTGAHRFAVFLQSNVGTTSLYSATHQVLYVTEIKR